MKDTTITELLKQPYSAELETVENYLANSVWLDGIGAREVSESLAEEVGEELGQATKLAHRLKQLGVCPPGSLSMERTQKSLQPPTDSTNVLSVVKGVLDAENNAIAHNRKLVKACGDTDCVTQDLAVEILADEEEHRCLFEGFLTQYTPKIVVQATRRASYFVVLLLITLASASAAEGEKHLRLLHIADTHAQLETHPEYMPGEQLELQPMGGYARLKTAFDQERASAKGAVFIVDGGDTFQGSGPAAWSKGQVVVGPLNALGLDAFVPGNWEPVYGPVRLRELMKQLKATVICYNLHDEKSGERLFKPAVTVEKNGVRVAFVGVTDWTTTLRQSPDEVRGLDSTRVGGMRDFVRSLKKDADLVVAVTHTGLTVSRHLARIVPEFDVILSGHTHERTYQPIMVGRVIVVEPGSMGSFYGRLDLTLRDGKVADSAFKLVPVRATDFAEDTAVKKLVDTVLEPHRERISRVLGRSETPILRYDVLETDADDFISDVVRETANADLGFSNGFRFSPPISAGEIHEGDLWNLLPLDSRLKVGWVTGKELRAYLEQELELVFSANPLVLSGGWGPRASGLVFSFAARAPAGQRLRTVQVGGRDVVDDRHYTFAGCERAGEPLDVICRKRGTHDVRILPFTIHEAMPRYFAKHPVITPKRDERAVAVDLPARVFSQDKIVSAHPAPWAEIEKNDLFAKPPNTPTVNPNNNQTP
jgi:2',3'-cyclic-nucleotide 2'-phosphodiesterase (5'-nucleotidase family)/ferritin-like protein